MLTIRYSDEWDGAACAQIGGNVADELFFPIGPDKAELAAKAKTICRVCPLREECVDAALEEETGTLVYGRFGIRGGLEPIERLRLAREREHAERAVSE